MLIAPHDTSCHVWLLAYISSRRASASRSCSSADAICSRGAMLVEKKGISRSCAAVGRRSGSYCRMAVSTSRQGR
ncbi:hypothetical protein STCU_12223 [Strigomonas culicis]|uniref:Uncharacterized protein n=1 Tax=Strigomonas culicis TaxID=28005 RepID=S9UXG5_9TRYP|nr:hypothetical protein STCU_12223 [Strigomonas culicis]|eukprot:EPY15230.1 hypothetical protein STCU_12223 [Strigomonas culicis]